MDSSNLSVITGIIINVVSVVGIVICNKYITEKDDYKFIVFLSFLNFLFTTVSTRIFLFFRFFNYKHAQIQGILPVCIGSLFSVAFMNLNLEFNSVGFYQVSKLACIPFTLLVQYLFYDVSVSHYIQFTLFVITFGVGYATVYDFSLSTLGLVFASCAVTATSLAQIFTNTSQKCLGCDAMQLLYHTSPIITAGMLCLAYIFDDMNALWQYQYTNGCLTISCLLAFGVNVSNYLVLGKTSPLTYQVLGHFKTILILVLGFCLFGVSHSRFIRSDHHSALFKKSLDYRNVIGIVVALAGVIGYTEVKRRASNVDILPESVLARYDDDVNKKLIEKTTAFHPSNSSAINLNQIQLRMQ